MQVSDKLRRSLLFSITDTALHFVKAIFSSRITLPSRQRFIIGQPIPIRITLESSQAWCNGVVDDELQMIYDVLVDKENWLVTGKKRGTFPITVSFDSPP